MWPKHCLICLLYTSRCVYETEYEQVPVSSFVAESTPVRSVHKPLDNKEKQEQTIVAKPMPKKPESVAVPPKEMQEQPAISHKEPATEKAQQKEDTNIPSEEKEHRSAPIQKQRLPQDVYKRQSQRSDTL